MFSRLFSCKCGCILISSSFLCLFMLGGLSFVSADENNHEKDQVKYMIDQKVACWKSLRKNVAAHFSL